MPHASSSSTTRPDVAAPGGEPVVHLTRRARIEAERRAAAAQGPVATVAERTAPSFDELVTPTTPPAPASPTDLAPTSPVLPGPSAGAVTPPAPSSPVVAPSRAVPASSARTRAARAVPAPAASGPAPVVQGRVVSRGSGAPRTGRATATAKVDRATRHLAAASAPSTPSAPRGASFRRAASRVTAVGALLFAAGLVVSTSLPAQALWVPTGEATAARSVAGAAQSLSVGDGAADAETSRDQYSVTSATQYKNVDASSFSNDPNGTIQWPFLTGVPITSGFGGRQVEGCSFCSTNHMGVDFAPGEGTPIRSVAAGTVLKVQAHDGGFGNDVWVQHDVDGKQFVSVYGHMKDGTFKVVTGQQVAVGDELGEVGSTGNSTGPHLHLEIHVDGVPVDPLAWLRANAN